jgi:hypothetical protein
MLQAYVKLCQIRITLSLSIIIWGPQSAASTTTTITALTVVMAFFDAVVHVIIIESQFDAHRCLQLLVKR